MSSKISFLQKQQPVFLGLTQEIMEENLFVLFNFQDMCKFFQAVPSVARRYKCQLINLVFALKDTVKKIAAVQSMRMQPDSLGIIFVNSIANRQKESIQVILGCSRTKEIPVYYIGKALAISARDEDKEVVQSILKKCPQWEQVNEEDLDAALTHCVENGDIKNIQTILESSQSTKIDREVLGSALVSSAEDWRKENFETILKYFGSKISTDFLGEALISSAEGGHEEIVQIISEYPDSDKISIDDLWQAIQKADENDHPEIVQAIQLLWARRDRLGLNPV